MMTHSEKLDLLAKLDKPIRDAFVFAGGFVPNHPMREWHEEALRKAAERADWERRINWRMKWIGGPALLAAFIGWVVLMVACGVR